jgi:hypothetical protein
VAVLSLEYILSHHFCNIPSEPTGSFVEKNPCAVALPELFPYLWYSALSVNGVWVIYVRYSTMLLFSMPQTIDNFQVDRI